MSVNADSNLHRTPIIQKMEPIAIVAAVSFGVLLAGGVIFIGRKCKRPTMKPSRSDTDLTQLTEVSSEVQYA